jgi:hypothetical protein
MKASIAVARAEASTSALTLLVALRACTINYIGTYRAFINAFALVLHVRTFSYTCSVDYFMKASMTTGWSRATASILALDIALSTASILCCKL